MQAVIEFLESLVATMAVAAFAHFGVALKDCDCAKARQTSQPVPVSAPAPSVVRPGAGPYRLIRNTQTV